MNVISNSPAPAPVIPIVSERTHLATFSRAYAVAVRLKHETGATQYVVSTNNPQQPFRVLRTPPAEPSRLVSTIA